MAYSTKFSQPRVGVLGGSIWRQPRWIPADRSIDDRNTANGVDALAFAFNGEYIDYTHVTKADLSRFDVIFANANRIPRTFLHKQLQLLEHLPSSVRWISIIEGNANDYLPPDSDYKKILDAAHLVDVINAQSAPFFRRLTNTPITTIGLPYPVDGAASYSTPYHQRRRDICLCPILLKRMNEVMVARELSMPYYGFSQVMLRRLNRIVSNWKSFGSIVDKQITIKNTHAAYNDPQLTVYHEKNIVDYFRYNGAAMLWINLDDRYTWGRYVLDAAALRMPIITTESTVHGQTLFPETTIRHHFDLDAAVEIGKRLVNDNEFYIHCAENAFAQLQQFSFDAVQQKFLDIFSEL